MTDKFLVIDIIHKDFFPNFESKFLDNIANIIELGEYLLIQSDEYTSDFESENSTHNINIGVAAAITAYARIHMSQFKNNPKINLYYSDTDSIYTDSELDNNLISETVLGKLKLENICKKAIFLTPKVYCWETIDGKVIYKVKGLKHDIELTMSDFEGLLYKDSLLEKLQDK
jgi:hypothetical protein